MLFPAVASHALTRLGLSFHYFPIRSDKRYTLYATLDIFTISNTFDFLYATLSLFEATITFPGLCTSYKGPEEERGTQPGRGTQALEGLPTTNSFVAVRASPTFSGHVQFHSFLYTTQQLRIYMALATYGMIKRTTAPASRLINQIAQLGSRTRSVLLARGL